MKVIPGNMKEGNSLLKWKEFTLPIISSIIIDVFITRRETLAAAGYIISLLQISSIYKITHVLIRCLQLKQALWEI